MDNSVEVIQIIDEQLATDGIVSLSDCQFPDHIEDPFLLFRVLFGNEFVRDLEFRDDPEFISHIMYKWVKILRRVLDAQGTQSRQRQEITRA